MKINLPKVKKPQISVPKVSKETFTSQLPKIRRVNRTTILAALSYIYILDLIPLALSKKNSFVRYHALQGLVLLIIWTIGLFTLFLAFIPWVVGLFVALCVITGIVNVFRDREHPLPLIGAWAEKI